ncbi:hypothetical protein GGR21_003664 [Dysgonomonas hofstadii]|uniref:Glycoside hydrolase Family 18, chitinase_18 n=1 Tax=Dysgonomonas hofstadii TaxID=637886 RepID=A0A840D0D3_9BACT|nr:glycoside hydrolase family 18 [Dysgonomonas hofstadii]MBB4037743.1 hypothetical protein [Dysgonomonas hofstadii]
MNKMLKYKIIAIVSSLLVAFASCDDWTGTESINLIEADIEKDNPELYAQYLANLRAYRNTDHKVTYVWFDNTKNAPVSRGEQISAIPDSIDVVNLTNPDDLSSWVMSDMKSVRENKGMKFVFTISYPDIEKEYEQYLSQNEEGDESADGFLAYAADFVDKKLALIDKYGYDGISVLFYGMKTIHLGDEAKEAYLARENAFMSKISTWVAQKSDKIFIFEGNPQNLTDKSILQEAEFIVVRTESLKYASGLSYEVLLTIEDGVPTDRFLITVNTKSLDATDLKTGYYYNSENELVSCIPLAAEWIDTYESKFKKAGLGILNVQNDYYNSGNSYMNIRNSISTMNPSPKE